jgi:Uma2 family endonuclease
MTDPARVHDALTVEDYLAFADAHPRTRFQLLAGVPVAMAPPTLRHEMICANIDGSLRPRLKPRGCRTHRDVGVAAASDADFMPEPDVMVRCGPIDDRRRWVSDPMVVFEVLSPSTLTDDRGYKLDQYWKFASLRQIVLVYQDEVRVEHWVRDGEDRWSEGPEVLKAPSDVLVLPALDATLRLAEIYEGVSVDR